MTPDDIKTKIRGIKLLAQQKALANAGKPKFLEEIECNLDLIGHAKLAGMAPINENLFGIAQLLLAECKRLRNL